MNPIIVPDVETAFGDIPNKPFQTRRKNIRIDDNGKTIDSKTLQWNEIGTDTIKVNFFMGIPYIQIQTS